MAADPRRSYPGGLRKRKLTFEGKSGFPTGLYFSMLDMLEGRGYTIVKVEDWLEVNPQSDFYEDISQKKQTVEQQVGRVLKNLSQTRKELEMLKHDRRKLGRIIDHYDEGDMDVLKSDFVDLVDRNTNMSLLDLANSGRLPSIVVDFYKVEEEEDIDKLDVSKGEKQILRKKWKLFQDWLDRYVGEIQSKKEMIEGEIRSRKATIENYKKSLKPYAKALKRIRLTEPEEYKGLSDPRIIERYPGSVSGVKLYAWQDIRELHSGTGSAYAGYEENVVDYSKIPEGIEGHEFYLFLEIEVSKKSFIVSGNDAEGITIEIDPNLYHRKDLEEKKEEIERKEKDLLKSIDVMGGEPVDTTEEDDEEDKERVGKKMKKFGKRILRIPPEREPSPGQKAEFKYLIEDEMNIIYEKIKDLGGGIRIWKLIKGGAKGG